MKRQLTIFLLLLLAGHAALAQVIGFSFGTDLSVQRNFKKEQQFWTVGQSIQLHYHFTKKDGLYIWFVYYSNGNFKNNITATAKDPGTTPSSIDYVNSGNMRTKHFSVGWKKYLKGNYDEEKTWNLYGYAGFGLLLGRVTNTHSVGIDTTLYHVPVRDGKGNFKRLTFDLGLGYEYPIGGDFFIYSEGRMWIPATEYPSKYLFVNDKAPFAGMMSLGLRLVF